MVLCSSGEPSLPAPAVRDAAGLYAVGLWLQLQPGAGGLQETSWHRSCCWQGAECCAGSCWLGSGSA